MALLLVLGACMAIVMAVPPLLGPPTWLTVVVALVALGVYGAAGYFVRARPNHDELGERHLFDFRLSDDVNQLLLGLVIVLAPSRFVSTSLADGVMLFTQGQLPQQRFVERARRSRS